MKKILFFILYLLAKNSFAQESPKKIIATVIGKYILPNDTVNDDYIKRARLDSFVFKILIENVSKEVVCMDTKDGYLIIPRVGEYIDIENVNSIGPIFDLHEREHTCVSIKPNDKMAFYITANRKDERIFIKKLIYHINLYGENCRLTKSVFKISFLLDYSKMISQKVFLHSW